MNEAFPGQYIKAADLQGKRVAVVIDEVQMEDIGGEQKPVLHFKGKERGMVLNRTNATMISEILASDETDDWSGGEVVLYSTKVDFQGRRVDAIRVDYPAKGKAKPKPKEPEPTDETTDDSVPF